MASSLRNRQQAALLPEIPTYSKPTEKSGTSEPKEEKEPRVNHLSLLPTEIHLAISQLLIYPDALSLKHSNRHFYNIVDTSILLKVEWLIERRSLHLECPNDRRCDLGSDLRFCRGSVPYVSSSSSSSSPPRQFISSYSRLKIPS